MTNIQFYPGSINAGDCISNAWNMIKQDYGLYLGIAIIAILLAGCIPCVSLFLMGPILGGVYYVVLRSMRGEPVEFGMMFRGFDKFVPLMVVGLIQAVPEIIAQLFRFTVNMGQLGLTGSGGRDFQFFQEARPDLAIASGILVIAGIVGLVFVLIAVVWRILLFFAIPLALEHDLSPIDAIKLSIKAATANLGGMIVLFILEFLVILIGILMLCLGVFLVSIPIIYVANAFAYRQVFPYFERNFNMSPPPPTAYGGSYGQQQ
jgi:uncharacterized membrane protein